MHNLPRSRSTGAKDDYSLNLPLVSDGRDRKLNTNTTNPVVPKPRKSRTATGDDALQRYAYVRRGSAAVSCAGYAQGFAARN